MEHREKGKNDDDDEGKRSVFVTSRIFLRLLSSSDARMLLPLPCIRGS
jgi:hypothetical protein